MHVRTCFARLVTLFSLPTLASAADAIRSDEPWFDTSGNRIHAHGGGLLRHEGVYYWHGEDRTRGGIAAVNTYTSTNLLDWRFAGVALRRESLPLEEGQRTFVERPKVIRNPRTGKFVMWAHLEQRGYHYARAGVAIADQPEGPFTFLHAIRPVTNDFDFPAGSPNRQKELGGTFRDMNLFLDNDGRAYVFYASEDNWTMYVVRLNEEFTGPETPTIEGRTWARILVRDMREAPAPFKHNGRYYLITSGCTGWRPNPARWHVADSPLGPWHTGGDPCVGPEADTTFRAQSTFVFPLPDRPGEYLFMADRWNPQNLPDSRYVWLPLRFDTNGAPRLEWVAEWKP
ncbi:MAG: glycoside hydrolase family 43 protein [Limisphaerales bacterium]